jgi:nucleoside-diphosphate-sugar epimerase
LVNAGTSWEYTDSGGPEPLNLYAAVKKSNAIVLDWYARQHPIRAINLKLNDTYGGDDRRTKLMPLLKYHAFTGEPVQLGYSAQPLNLTYITDVLRAILWAGQLTADQQPGTVEEAFLFGAETPTIGEIVALIQQITDNALNVRFRGTTPTDQLLRGIWHDAPRLRDWRPKTDLRTGLENYLKAGD